MEGKRRRFKKLGGDMEKMKEKYMVIPIVILAVLISVSSAPAMQTTFMSEYQPICPEES